MEFPRPPAPGTRTPRRIRIRAALGMVCLGLLLWPAAIQAQLTDATLTVTSGTQTPINNQTGLSYLGTYSSNQPDDIFFDVDFTNITTTGADLTIQIGESGFSSFATITAPDPFFNFTNMIFGGGVQLDTVSFVSQQCFSCTSNPWSPAGGIVINSGTNSFTIDAANDLSGTDGNGLFSTASFRLTFVSSNSPPTADTSNTTDTIYSATDTSLTLSGTASSDPEDGTNISYTWTPGGSTPNNSTTVMSLAAAAAAGLTNPSLSLNVNLEVRDSGNLTDNASLLLTYDNANPTGNGSGNIDQTGAVTASANLRDVDFDKAAGFDDNVHFEWFDPDGTTSLDGDPEVTGDTEGFRNANDTLTINMSAARADPIINDGDPSNDFLILRLFDIENGQANAIDFQIPLRAGGSGGGAGVPEPASIAIWSLLGLGMTGYFWRRKRVRG